MPKFRTIPLINGGTIKISPEDYDWVSGVRWKHIKLRTKTGFVTAIENADQSKDYLHLRFFPHRKNYRTVQSDGDPFNFQRDNVKNIPYHKTIPKKPPRKEASNVNHVEVNGINEIGVWQCRCVITNTEKAHREDECCDCAATHFDSHYQHCLETAADLYWNGWTRAYKGGCPVIRVVNLESLFRQVECPETPNIIEEPKEKPRRKFKRWRSNHSE